MSQMVLFENISKHFGEVIALNRVNLAVKRGEFLSLLGPSGCGKTTLLRSCAGLEPLTKGRVYLENQDVTDIPPHRRPVNMVFQRWALFPHMTVSENIRFGLAIKKVPKSEISRRVGSILELVKMKDYDDRYPRQLSGGQAQRIALARALVMQPKVLLLDEPLGSLDLKLRQEMQFELINIHKQLGTTFIYVTHDQEEALTMSDRIVVMKDGAIVQDGSPSEIYQEPNSVFSAQFIGETILFSGKVETTNGAFCTVDTGELLLHCAGKPGLHVGQHVSVCIRPERVQLALKPDEKWDNRLQGHMVNTIFKGPIVLYQLKVTRDRMITIPKDLKDNTPPYIDNSLISIGWSREQCIVLTE